MKQDLKALIQEAHQRRKKLQEITSAYRFFAGSADGLNNLFIDKINDVFIIQSFSSETDQLLKKTTEILVEEFKPRAVLLKNTSSQRLHKNLQLEDSIVYGSLPEPVLKFYENEFTYSYDTASPHSFPIEDRLFRKVMTENFNESFLCIDPLAKQNLPLENKKPHTLSKRSFTDTTAELRNSATRYQTIALNLRTFSKRKSFSKSLFHLLFQVVNHLEKDGLIVFNSNHFETCFQVFNQVSSKQNLPFILESLEFVTGDNSLDTKQIVNNSAVFSCTIRMRDPF